MVVGGTPVGRRLQCARDFALHGVDISQYQGTWMVPQMIDFAIVRATFGARKDIRCVEHVQALRKRTACAIGLYHFFVPSHGVDDQVRAFAEQADACGMGAGDIIPHIDVEDTSGQSTNPPRQEWCGPLRDVGQAFDDRWGQHGDYLTQRDWVLLGRPQWILESPLWVAHWRADLGLPASPGGVTPWCWQHRVAPYKRGALHEPDVTKGVFHPRAIDHDCVTTEVPLIVAAGEEVAQVKPAVEGGLDDELTDDEVRLMRRARGLQFGLSDEDWDDMRDERDRAVKEQD